MYDKLAQFLDKQIRQDLTDWFKNSNEVKIFISGRTGAGKSTLVNGLVGKKVAEEGDTLNPETSVVKSYKGVHGSVHVTVWDSPGLQDGTKNELQYLADIKEKCTDIDIFIYCVSLTQTRFFKGCADSIAMKKLTDALGKEIWGNAMFVLTFANLAEDSDSAFLQEENKEKKAELFQTKIQQWKETLANSLAEDAGIDRAVADDIEVVPAGHASEPALLDRPHWLSPIWFTALYAMHPRAQPAMVKLNRHRIVKSPKEICKKDLQRFIHEQPLIFSKRGALAGAKYGESDMGQKIGSSMGEEYSDNIQQLAHDMYTSTVKRYGRAIKDMVKSWFKKQ